MWPSYATASRWYDAANTLLIVALALGALSTVLVVWMGHVKEEYLRRDVAAAGERASVADARAAEATLKANEAELRLIEFRKSRREILAEPGHVASFIEKIKPFAGTKFDIGHAPDGREQWDFLWDVEPEFQKAGWVFVDWRGPQVFGKLNWTMQQHLYGVANVLNVSVEMSPESRDKLLAAAEALAAVLNGIGIAATVEPFIVSSTSANTDALHFLVGEKR